MTKEELLNLLHNPDQTGHAIDKLNRLIDEYPYFHTGHQLYLKGLRQTDEKKMPLQLKKTALYVRDRDVLYHYINRPSPQTSVIQIQNPSPPSSLPRQAPSPEDEERRNMNELAIAEENISASSVEIRDVYSEGQLVADLIRTSHRKIGSSGTQPQITPVKEETTENNAVVDNNRRWTSGELIDFFLKSNHKIVPGNSQYEADLSESLIDNQEIFTETLADIYATQGYKDKAIEIYEHLILKYPEKHIYFAAQIERLK